MPEIIAQPFALDLKTLVKRLKSSIDKGLTQENAGFLINEFGKNDITVSNKKPTWRILLDQFIDPIILILSLVLAPIKSNAQEEEKVTVKISGHVWAESIFDTRQTVNARENDVLLYPAKEILDANGKDINAKSSFNMLNIHSRARLKITAPKFLNAKVSGLLEGDFVGSANDKIGLFRLSLKKYL